MYSYLDDPSRNGAGPQTQNAHDPVSTSPATNRSDCQDVVQPADVADAVARAPFADLFFLLDPAGDLVVSLTYGAGYGPSRCPACGRRAVQVENVVTAWCGSCNASFTRWGVAQQVLRDRRAVLRVAACLSRGCA